MRFSDAHSRMAPIKTCISDDGTKFDRIIKPVERAIKPTVSSPSLPGGDNLMRLPFSTSGFTAHHGTNQMASLFMV